MSKLDKKLKDAIARLQNVDVLSYNVERVINGFIVTVRTQQGSQVYLARDKDEVRELVIGTLK